jgi:DNA-binding NarL/FixJ family response regulator/REP element-mobilizing transposase RayT
MHRVILVVSPDTEFLQQLRSHLEEGGRYQVSVALSAHEALNLANSNFFEVAIVDGELDDIPVAAFTRDLTALQSDLKILVFPPDNNPQHPVLDGVAINGFLTKPFSGQEIGKALSSLFSDQPIPNNLQVKEVDDLVKQWLQIPETGGKKAEQILKATSAQTILIIIKDQVIASAGPMDDGLMTNVTGFLSRYWKDEDNSELARYIKLDGDSRDQFIYATKLVSNLVLVMVYPMKATIQLVRRELNIVKDDFQKQYPTTSEIKQDLAKYVLAGINARNKVLETLQKESNTFSQDDIDALGQLNQQTDNTGAISQVELEARKLFEQESLMSKPKPTINAISQEEIDLLKALQNEPSQPSVDSVTQAELEARKLFEQESVKPKPMIAGISQEEIDLLKAMQNAPTQPAANAVSQAELEARKLFEQESVKPKPMIAGISQEEIDLLKAMQNAPAQPAVNAVSQAELEARKLFEQESVKPKPMIAGISQEEIDLLKAMQNAPAQPAVNAVSQAELEARKLFEQESLNKTIVTSNDVSQVELDALNLAQHKSTTPDSVNPSNISEQELSQLSKLLEQMPTPDPQSEGETAVEDKKLPEWLNELETADNITQSSVANNAEPMANTPIGISPFLEIDENLKTSLEKGEPLPEIDFTLPWEIEETTAQAVAEITANQTIEVKTDDTLKPEIEQPVALVEPVEEAAVEALQPTPTSFAEVLNAVAPQVGTAPTTVESAASPAPESVVMDEPATPPAPPSLKDFRFNYTLVLLPGDRNQFLTKNLSDKLSAIMPDIHEDQGWKMTSITVRPQYLLWTVAVSMGICPKQILNEVRNLTSNAIFAAFAEIAKTKTSNDFWSSEYLAVSGSEPAPANLVFDFVKTAWKTPETVTA